MHLMLDTLVSSILISLFPALINAATTVGATLTTDPPPPVTTGPSSCVTVTSTNGGACPTPTPCIMAACLLLSSVTLGCGCPSIYTERVCASTCPVGCGTAYSTVYLPCATSISGPASSSSLSSSSSSPSSFTTSTPGLQSNASTATGACVSKTHPVDWNGTETVTCTQTVPVNTTTVVITSTSIFTISSCPAQVTCHGQTSSWTGVEGPYTCQEEKTCSCVFPGGGNATLTGTGTVGITGGGSKSSSMGPVVATTPGRGTSTTRAAGSTTSAVQVQPNNARKQVSKGWVEGWMVGILGLVLGGL